MCVCVSPSRRRPGRSFYYSQLFPKELGLVKRRVEWRARDLKEILVEQNVAFSLFFPLSGIPLFFHRLMRRFWRY